MINIFLTNYILQIIKTDILTGLHYVVFPLSGAIEKIFASKQKKTGGIRFRDLS